MSLFNRWLSRELSSKEIAKHRLKMLLIHDRANLSPGKIEQLKAELAEVTSKYVDIDLDGIEISLTHTNRKSHLRANFPIMKVIH